jgi:NAD(P)-dependent dehydrogenase (short-subunit alcohol dehydrogenase family)
MARRPADPAYGVAWVTGASSGIGKALAKVLARRGWKVALSARSANDLKVLAEEIGPAAMVAACDIADAASVQAAAKTIRETFGPIGLVVANAGIYLPTEAPDLDLQAFQKTFDVNLMGTVRVVSEALKDMKKSGAGHIHVVSSATGFGGMPTSSAYGASKAALINMAECWKIELERWNIGVSISTPGFVETPAQDNNAFPKPFMIQPDEAALRIADAVARGGFETSFPRRFTWALKALYALPKFIYLPLVRRQTGWNKPPENR